MDKRRFPLNIITASKNFPTDIMAHFGQREFPEMISKILPTLCPCLNAKKCEECKDKETFLSQFDNLDTDLFLNHLQPDQTDLKEFL